MSSQDTRTPRVRRMILGGMCQVYQRDSSRGDFGLRVRPDSSSVNPNKYTAVGEEARGEGFALDD